MTLAATLILCVVSWYSYGIARTAILKESNEDVRDLTQAVQNHIEGVLKGARKIPELFAEVLEHRLSNLSPASYPWLIGSETSDIHNLVKSIIARNEEVFGICIAFEPDFFQPGRRFAAPYFYRADRDIKLVLTPDSSDYFASGWYSPPEQKSFGLLVGTLFRQ